MRVEFTAVVEPAEEGGHWAICAEVPGANGQGETIEETKRVLAAVIQLVLQGRRKDALRRLPQDAIRDTVGHPVKRHRLPRHRAPDAVG